MLRGGAAATGLDWRRVNQRLLQLHLTTPGLQLRVMMKQEEAAAHVLHTARVSGAAALGQGGGIGKCPEDWTGGCGLCQPGPHSTTPCWLIPVVLFVVGLDRL